MASHRSMSRLMRDSSAGRLGLPKQFDKPCCEPCDLGWSTLVHHPPQGLSDDLVVAPADRHILKCTLQVKTLGPLRLSRSIHSASPPYRNFIASFCLTPIGLSSDRTVGFARFAPIRAAPGSSVLGAGKVKFAATLDSNGLAKLKAEPLPLRLVCPKA